MKSHESAVAANQGDNLDLVSCSDLVICQFLVGGPLRRLAYRALGLRALPEQARANLIRTHRPSSEWPVVDHAEVK